jgi:hypothetical protein
VKKIIHLLSVLHLPTILKTKEEATKATGTLLTLLTMMSKEASTLPMIHTMPLMPFQISSTGSKKKVITKIVTNINRFTFTDITTLQKKLIFPQL